MSVVSSQEREIFLSVLDAAEGTERQSCLDQACGGDEALRRQIERLLEAHSELGDFLEQSPATSETDETLKPGDGPSTPDGEPLPPRPGVMVESLDFLEPCKTPGRLGRIGSHEVTQVIGRGGMGIVLHAIDTKLERHVAIKVMAPEIASDPTAVKRFLREAKLAAAVRHDHLVTIHAVDEWRGRPYLVMEYIDGGSLKELLKSRGTLEADEAIRIARQLAAGLAAAHRHKLVHRDIKPANILMERDTGRIKITDFGLARVTGEAGLSRSGEVVGTPQFMAPEQAQGREVDQRADLFSLGSLLYSLCSGQSPFQADSILATMRCVCDVSPRRLKEVVPGIPDWFDRLVHRLLEKDPAARFQSADEVEAFIAEQLAATQVNLLLGSTASMPTVSQQPDAHRPLPSRRVKLGIVAVLLVLLGFAVLPSLLAFAGYVIRVTRGDGTIEFRVDDPSVEVTISDGDKYEFRRKGESSVTVHPGDYLVKYSKPGEPPKQERVTIERHGRKVVTLIIRPHDTTGDEATATPIAALGRWSEPVRVEG